MSDESFLDRVLSQPVESPTYVTPWGTARSMSRHEIDRVRRGERGITRAQLCVLYRDRLEDEGRDPRQAMDGAIALVRRNGRRRR